jgi:O-antigen/teichoic acid export membrane protein
LRIARNAAWLTACRLSGDVLNLLLFVLLSRQFGPAGVGTYSYGFAVATFVFVIGCLGIEEYGIRQYSRMEPAAQAGFLAQLLGTQAVMVAVATTALAIYLLITAPTAQKLAIILELTCYQIAAAVSVPLFIPEMAYQRMSYPALAELTSRIVAFTGAGIAIYVLHASLALALIGFPLAAAVWMCLAVRSARARGPLYFTVSRAAVGRIAGIIWSFALIEIFGQLFARAGVIVLSLAVGDAAAGVFATGLRLVETALVPLGYFGIAFYPQLSRLFSADIRSFRRTAMQVIWLMLLAGMLVAWGLYFVAPSLLVPVFGERFAGTAPIMRLMAGLALVQALEAGLGRVLLSADLQVARALFIAVAALASVGLNIAFTPRFGVDGAIVSGVAAYGIINVLSLLALKRPLTGAALLPLIWTLVLGVAVGGGVVGVLAANGCGPAPQAITAAAVLAMVAAAGYLYRFGERTPASAHSER